MSVFKLMTLPYSQEALEPAMSAETLSYHYGKHHQTYVNTLNTLLEDHPLAQSSLEEIIKNSDGPLFNNAAQVFNHNFFWQSMKPNGGGTPTGALLEAIEKTWGSFDIFLQAYQTAATGNFGSGWTWLVKNEAGELSFLNTSNAQTPVTQEGLTPLLTVDVWEHAYYIDHRNARPAYLRAFFEQLVNWDFAQSNFEK